MSVLKFVLTISAVVKRLELSRSVSYRQAFIELAPVLISVQDGIEPTGGTEHLIAPYQGMLDTSLQLLGRDREALAGSSGRLLRLPRGCRLGKLHFWPLLQLAKLHRLSGVDRVQFEEMPRTKAQLSEHLRTRIALGKYGSEPPCFSNLFGFALTDYAGYLSRLRRSDPVLFTMLLANEFQLARDWAIEHCPESLRWVKCGAALGELERLVEIVSFINDRPESLAQLRRALRVLAKGSATRCSPAKLREYRRMQAYIDQLGFSVEALRALFLGDGACGPIAPKPDWGSTTLKMRRVAATRCSWFANDGVLSIPGFRTPPKRFVRSRRGSAYTYYGIPLNALLAVGVKDLSLSVGHAGAAEPVNVLASVIFEGITGRIKEFDRIARQSEVYQEIYLRELGHGGSGARFHPEGWFQTSCDEALYTRLWRLFVGDCTGTSSTSVRYQIRSSIQVLNKLLIPVWREHLAVDPSAANRAIAQLACGLTPLSMDPIFAALVERALVERNVPTEFRSDPARSAKVSGAAVGRYLSRFMNPFLRSSYSRFEGVDGRPNHLPGSAPPPALVRTKTLPRQLRPAATSTA